MDITHNFKINTSIDKVSAAITTEEGINGWWSKNCEIGQAVGETTVLNFIKEGTPVRMEFKVIEFSSNEIRWKGIENPNPAWIGTHISFSFKEAGDEVDFTLKHTGWDEQWSGQAPYTNTKETWGFFMGSLKNYLENGEGQPW